MVDRRGCLTFHESFSQQACHPTLEPAYERRSAFEEYRYDALGRRVLVRTRQTFSCVNRCLNQVRRTVYDGDQVLIEIAAPGADGTDPTRMEADQGLATPFGGGFYPTGRVEYVHGAGLDKPLALLREEYSDSIQGGVYTPMANSRGAYDSGEGRGQCYTRTWTTQPADPPNADWPSNSGQPPSSGGTSGTEVLCADVDWPAEHIWAYRQYRRGYAGPSAWMGSLVYESRDASGLHYRRNRFYDAEQGRLTQEDPIGLAGGINVYGFANGDPVTYSDPYGLSAAEKSGGADCEKAVARCPTRTTTLMQDKRLRRDINWLFSESQRRGVEMGAYIFRRDDGSFRLGTASGAREAYVGEVGQVRHNHSDPDNAVGFVHTHPDQVLSTGTTIPGSPPSGPDAVNARVRKYFNVIVNRENIYIYHPFDDSKSGTFNRKQWQ